jgi:hypothetical protein
VASRFWRELGLVFGWLAFPLVPVILEALYYQNLNSSGILGVAGPEPRDWDWGRWVIVLGPLIGYGFLAGATVDLPDDPEIPRSRFRRLLARRSVWMAIGPWAGFLCWATVGCVIIRLTYLIPDVLKRVWDLAPGTQNTWVAWALGWLVLVLFGGTLAYGWLWPAWAALRRAAKIGRWRRSLFRGLIMALGFVGSLFGSFWAATAMFRSYFFDPRLVPLVAAAVGLLFMSGCDSTITYGEMRRRDLFHAMVMAWVFSLALMWRWWSRARPRAPRS